MGLALEEPKESDLRLEVDGIVLMIPPDTAQILASYPEATLDHDPTRSGDQAYFVRLGRRIRRY
jgi:hypothetical protein